MNNLFTFFLPVIIFLQSLVLSDVMTTRYRPDMDLDPEIWLNRGTWALLQTGNAPEFILPLVQKIDPARLSPESRYQFLLVLSLPASLTGKNHLPEPLEGKREKLLKNDFSRADISLLQPPLVPDISDNDQLIESQELFKNSLQLLALTIFESTGFTGEENSRLLNIVDRTVYYYSEWAKSARTLTDLDTLLLRWNPYFSDLEKIISNYIDDGKLRGEPALLAGQKAYIDLFTRFRRE